MTEAKPGPISIGATPDTEVQRKLRVLLENTKTKCIGNFKVVEPCKDRRPLKAILPMQYHLPEWFLGQCRIKAQERDLKFDRENPTSGWVIKINDIRHSEFYNKYNPGSGFHLGVEITWHEDDQEFVDLDHDTSNVRQAVRDYLNLLDGLESDIVEEDKMATITEQKDEGTDSVFHQLAIQEESLKALTETINVLGDRIYTILADEQASLTVDDNTKQEDLVELADNIRGKNRILTVQISKLSSIIERVRL